jgi:4-hydroxythreonine-4-phosphate dehydrogenase
VEIARVPLEVNAIDAVAQARFDRGTLNVFDLKNVDLAKLQLGKVSAMAGHAAFEACET